MLSFNIKHLDICLTQIMIVLNEYTIILAFVTIWLLDSVRLSVAVHVRPITSWYIDRLKQNLQHELTTWRQCVACNHGTFPVSLYITEHSAVCMVGIRRWQDPGPWVNGRVTMHFLTFSLCNCCDGAVWCWLITFSSLLGKCSPHDLIV